LLITAVVLIISCAKKDQEMPEKFNSEETYVLPIVRTVFYNIQFPLNYSYIEFPPNSLPYPGIIDVSSFESYDDLIPKYYRDSYEFYYFISEIQELNIPAKMALVYRPLLSTLPLLYGLDTIYPNVKVLNHSDIKVYKIENKGIYRFNSVLDISNWQEIPYLSIDSTDVPGELGNRIIFEFTDLTAIYVLAHEFE